MKSRTLKISTLVGASALMLGYAQAQTQFAFSFSGPTAAPYFVAGSVAGIITLNASQTAATSILLTSSLGDASSIGRDWVSDPAVTVFLNSFAVTGGNISNAQFDADFLANPSGQFSMGYQDLLSTSSGAALYNPGGDAAITFTPLPTPEPATLALTALGAGALLKIRRRQ